MASKISWTDETWNPVVGCTKVSVGCANCWAEKMAMRLAAIEYHKLKNHLTPHLIEDRVKKYMRVVKKGWNGNIFCDEKVLDKPLHWRKPRRIFVCSMSDLFHEKVPFGFIDKIVGVAEKCPQHTLQFLTKRAERMLEYSVYRKHDWPENIIGMVTAENQPMADLRIPLLLQCGFKTTGVSIEPMLGPVNINPWSMGLPSAEEWHPQIHWVIVGGESGPGARPMHPDWVHSARDQCVAANVPFFFKQWGEYVAPGQSGPLMGGIPSPSYKLKSHVFPGDGCFSTKVYRVGKKRAGNLLDGQVWEQFPKDLQIQKGGL